MIRKALVKVVQSALGASNLRLVRWHPTPVTGSGVGGNAADAATGAFFPTGVVRPWTIPADLRALAAAGMPWAAELIDLYQHNAAWPASIAPEAGMLLQSLVRNIGPSTIVETGTCVGASTIWMAAGLEMAGLPGAKVHTFDDYREVTDQRLALSPLFQNRLEGVKSRFARAKVDSRIHIHVGDSKTKLADARADLLSAGGVQFAFIDGDHSASGALADLLAVEPVLRVGGYVLFHDVFPETCNWTGPRYVADNLNTLAKGKYQLCDLYTAQTNYGLTLMRRIG